ncbi:hypothetical protein [Bacteroides sp. Marseille-P8574]|jgi:hypothetical protein|uniref:hypothetical protein n=1 Tax=Bacteroides sp. Marseille-P8574 TaxID=2697504 RepID=UPI00157D800A|nr:hypothetical protein [Bacteroides sp. Marseille-P8574]
MEGWIVLGIILIVAAYFFGRIGYSFNDEDQEHSDYTKMNEAVDVAIDAEDNKTRNLVVKTLKEIGCQPEVDDKDRIRFKYQGEIFFIDADNNYQFVTLWDAWWLCIDCDNANVEHLKKAINSNNINTIVSTFYTIDEDSKQMGVHCKAIFMLTPSIVNKENYLKVILNDCFKAHDLLRERFIRLDFKQEKHEHRRVVVKGFN